MRLKEDFLRKNYYRIYGLLLAAAACAFALLMRGKTVWSDEAYTFAMIRHSYSEICRLTALDVHPPLYYIVLKTLTAPFGYDLTAAMIVSAIPFLGIPALGGIQLRKLFGEKTALLFMGLFLLFPFALVYVFEVRMYSLAAFFVFAAGIFALKAYREDKKLNWALFALCGTAAAYTHYFALVAAGVIYGILFLAILIRRRKKIVPWLIAAAVTIVLYVPWLKCFIEQLVYKVNNEYWIPGITVSSITGYITALFGCSDWTVFVWFFSLAYLAALIILLRCGDRETLAAGLCALAVPVGTLLIGVGASILVRPVFIIRYIMPAVPLLVAFMAIALGQCKNRTVLACILTVAVMGGVTNYVSLLPLNSTDTEMDSAFFAAYEDVDCIEAIGCESGFSYVVSYYEPEIPICTDETVPLPAESLPFGNITLADSADFPAYEKVLLFLGGDETMREEYSEGYAVEYIGRVSENGTPVYAYLLTAEH